MNEHGRVITLWYRQQSKDEAFKFNHISEGYESALTEPVPISDSQRTAWKGAKWRSKKGELVAGCIKSEQET